MTMPSSNPFLLWSDDPDARIPHEEVRQSFALWLTEANRPFWDARIPDFGRDYFLKRVDGLKAYSTYEADYYLGVLARHDPRGKMKYPEEWREDQFAECMVLEQLHRTGENALVDDSYKWLVDVKRKQRDTTFSRRVDAHLDLGRSNRGANPKIKMYAWGYDRFYIPLEYCPDSFAEEVFFKASQSKERRDEWANQKSLPNTASIEKWRKILGLKTTRPHAAKWKKSSKGFKISPENCVELGIPLEASLRRKILKAGVSLPPISELNH